jgi:hypothetical protein
LKKAAFFKDAGLGGLSPPWFHLFSKHSIYFYALIPLLPLINISSMDFKLFPKNRNSGNMPLNCGKKSMRGIGE